ncbi:hypothetical protein LCGC14_1463910 [marine sediment metagenome]|uniref:Uncharacterized protein n=1 Tax=marine sediment metagenome TaxID=412755 RepID=A0A0F9JEA7_9ZZZZ
MRNEQNAETLLNEDNEKIIEAVNLSLEKYRFEEAI